MTNRYYNRLSDYTPHTSASGTTLQSEFEAVELGFDRIADSVGYQQRHVGVSLRFSAGDLPETALPQNASERANQLLGFDAAGNPSVLGTDDVPQLGGQRDVTSALHAMALPSHGFIPVYAGPTGPQQAIASAVETLATAFVVGVRDANTLRLARSGFISVPAHGLVIGTMYFLSQVASGITDTRPASGLVHPLVEAWDVNTLLLMPETPYSA